MKYHEIPIPIADSSKQYRLYYSEQYYCVPCPECRGLLGQKYSIGVFKAISEYFKEIFLIKMDNFSYFCNKCPVVVVNIHILNSMDAEIHKHPEMMITFEGFFNLETFPVEQRDMDSLLTKNEKIENYLTPFLPPLDKKNVAHVLKYNIKKAYPLGFNISYPEKSPMIKPEIKNTMPEKFPGRNDPCICGSGKKYKNCCFKLTH